MITSRIRRVVGAAKGRVRPVLSVVMPCRDAGQYLEPAIRSILNQSLRDLEVIVVDDASSDGSPDVVARLAARDKRVRTARISDGRGPGAARNFGAALARGQMIAFADADDLVLPGAYATMTRCLRNTSSDMVVGGYIRHGASGKHRPKLVNAVHAKQVLRTDVARFPDLLDEVVIWNRVFRTEFWRQAVGPFPEDANYEDRLPALRSTLRARTFDVLAQDVYSWRMPDGRSTRSQGKAETSDLRDRLAILDRELGMMAGQPLAVIERLLSRFLGHDLGLYIAHVPQADDEYWSLLAGAAARLSTLASDATWLRIPVADRLLSLASAAGSRHDVEELLGTYEEDTRAIPLRYIRGRFVAEHEVLSRLKHPVPPNLLEVDPATLRAETGLLSMRDAGAGLVAVDGWVRVPGVSPSTRGIDVQVLGSGASLPVTRHRDDLVDTVAGDPWVSYADAAFRVLLPAEPLPSALQVHVTLDDHEWVAELPLPTALDSAVDESARRLFVDTVDVRSDGIHLAGRVVPPPASPLRVGLVCSRRVLEAKTTVHGEGRFDAHLAIADCAPPSDGYFVRWAVGDGPLEGWAKAAGPLNAGLHEGAHRLCHVSTRRHPQGSLSLTIGPPLTLEERSRHGRRTLRDRYSAEPLERAVLFQSFLGKNTADNPGAIFESLRATGVDAPLYWSVCDRSVPVPDGGIPLVIGSSAWHRALATSRVLVDNNNFPHWFRKREGQFYLQTWHGVPIKRLLRDLDPRRVPLTYRRLMARQVPQWDLLLAPDAAAERDLRSGLGFDGPVLHVQQPRNAVLLADPLSARERMRERLGIARDEHVVLYAPTWREEEKRPGAAPAPWALDPERLAAQTGARVLVRSHHASQHRATDGDRVIDVTGLEPVAEIMAAADVLITDYSSLLVDWQLTNRPALVFAPDLEHYRDVERGFYCAPEEIASCANIADGGNLSDAVAAALECAPTSLDLKPDLVSRDLERVLHPILTALDTEPRRPTKKSEP